MPWDVFNTDPTGAAVRARADAHRRRFNQREHESYQALLRENPSVGLYGPLRMASSPNSSMTLPIGEWEGFKQALFENADEVASEPGMPVPRYALPDYMDPWATEAQLRTQQIGQPNNPRSVMTKRRGRRSISQLLDEE